MIDWTDAADRRLMLTMLREGGITHNWPKIAESLTASNGLGESVTANALKKHWKKILDKDSEAFSGTGEPTTPKAAPKRGRAKKTQEANDDEDDGEAPESPVKKPKSAKKDKPKLKEEPVEDDEPEA